ncbi:MAG TPA: hypothetical protein PKY81_04720 [bacterium]|nr:hypothetical protein [bacterium]
MADYLINWIYIFSAFIFPGWVIGQLFFQKKISEHSFPYRFASYVVLSLTIIFFSAFLLSKIIISLQIKKNISLGIIFIPAVCFIFSKINLLNKQKFKTFEHTPLLLISAIAMFILAAMIFIPLRPYPAINNAGMGDLPEYYALAKSLFLGKGWTIDYFIFDFWTGPKYSINDIVNSAPVLSRRPLSPYLTSFFFLANGFNHYNLNIMSSLLAALLPIIFYGFIIDIKIKKKGSVTTVQNLIFQLLSLSINIFPNHFRYFIFGSTSVFALFPIAVLIAFIKSDDRNSVFSIIIQSLCAGLISISRPESLLLLIIILFIFYLIPFLISLLEKRIIFKYFLICGGIIIFNIPLFFIKYGERGGMGYQTLKYDSEIKNFKSIYDPWYLFSLALTQENISLKPDIKNIINNSAFNDIKSHPFKFIVWLYKNCIENFKVFLEIFDIKVLNLNIGRFIILFIFGLLLYDCLLYYRKNSCNFSKNIFDAIINFSGLSCICDILFTFIFFLPGYALLNCVFFQRHSLILSPLIFVGMYISIINIWTKYDLKKNILSKFADKIILNIKIYNIILALCYVILISYLTVNAIEYASDNEYLKSLKVIKQYTEPNSVIVSDYPQLVNLMTDRISLGAYALLEILKDNLERYNPDYILLNDCRMNNYTAFLNLKNLAREYNYDGKYISKNYYVFKHWQKSRIILLKHY